MINVPGFACYDELRTLFWRYVSKDRELLDEVLEASGPMGMPTVFLKDYESEIEENLLGLSSKKAKRYLEALFAKWDEHADMYQSLAWRLDESDEAKAEEIGMREWFRVTEAHESLGSLKEAYEITDHTLFIGGHWIVQSAFRAAMGILTNIYERECGEVNKTATVTDKPPLAWLGGMNDLLELFVELDAKGYIKLPAPDVYGGASWDKISSGICALFDTSASRRADSTGEASATLATYFKSKHIERGTGKVVYDKITAGKQKFDSIKPNPKSGSK